MLIGFTLNVNLINIPKFAGNAASACAGEGISRHYASRYLAGFVVARMVPSQR